MLDSTQSPDVHCPPCGTTSASQAGITAKPPHHVHRPVSRTKTLPFRTFCYDLYAQYEWVSRYDDGLDTHVCISSPSLARLLRVPAQKMREQFKWLEKRGWIRDVHFSRGRVEFAVRHPPTWNWNGESDDSRVPPDNREVV